jgi:hypothetical protein
MGRDTRKYHLMQGKRVIHRGITSRPLTEREREHKQVHPDSRIKQVGRAVSWTSALEWERNGGKRPYDS